MIPYPYIMSAIGVSVGRFWKCWRYGWLNSAITDDVSIISKLLKDWRLIPSQIIIISPLYYFTLFLVFSPHPFIPHFTKINRSDPYIIASINLKKISSTKHKWKNGYKVSLRQHRRVDGWFFLNADYCWPRHGWVTAICADVIYERSLVEFITPKILGECRQI